MPVAATGSPGDRRIAAKSGIETTRNFEEVPAKPDRDENSGYGLTTIAGGDVLRSLLTLPSVAVANDFSSQHQYTGEMIPAGNVVHTGDVPFFGQDGGNSDDRARLATVIKNAAIGPHADVPWELFHIDITFGQVDRDDPRYKPVLPPMYYRDMVPTSPVTLAQLADMSVEESERKHTPYPFTDKGNHLCRDLVGYFNIKSLLKNDFLSAGSTFLLSTGFELIEPQIDSKVRGPNFYDPLYGAAGYVFYVLQDTGLIPRNFWWAIDFYTDGNPIHNAEHKPMRAELHCTLPTTAMRMDLAIFYDNHGYDPTVSYPTDVRISSGAMLDR